MRVIGGAVIALAVIFGTISLASADDTILIQDKRASDFAVDFANTKSVYEIVLIPHPCDPDSNLLFTPDDPITQCAQDVIDEELEEYISKVSIDAIGFTINLDELFSQEVTSLDDVEEQIIQFDTTSELIFEHEEQDLAETEFEEQIIAEYEIIKDTWEEELNKLEDDAKTIFIQNPGIKSKILKHDIEKLKIKFDLKEEKIKNTAKVHKKIKTAIELEFLKEKFQDSMNEYAVAEKVMKYGDEKDKKLEQLIKQNKMLMKKMLIVEAKHNDKKLEFDDFKKIDEKVTEEIKNSVSYNAGQTDADVIGGNGDAKNGNDSEQGKSGKASDNKGKGSDNKKSKGSDNKGKGSKNSKGKGKSNK